MSRIPATVTRKVERTTTSTRRFNPQANSTAINPRVTTASTSSISLSRVSRGSAADRTRIGTARPSQAPPPGPSNLQKKVFKQALAKTTQQPGKKVRSTGANKKLVTAPLVTTKRGKECVVQQLSMETTVQRTPMGEYIGKSMIGVDVDGAGVARQLEITSQQIDPTHATESAGVNETVSVTSSLSITTGGKQLKKSFKKRVVKSKKLADQANINRHHVNRLVREETEDVENTLKMVPPDLVSPSVERYPVKKKLQSLRLNAEPMSLLAQSVIHPVPTADEVEAEAPPEVVAEVIDAVEKGATPDSAPNQIFNSLFPEVQEPRIGVSAVAPGPLEDMVVPTAHAPKLVEEILTDEMEELLKIEVQNKQELPKDDIATDNNITAAERSPRGENKTPMLLESEIPPWEEATIQKLAALVGGDPIENLDASDVTGLESPEDINHELSKGIDYFIDADVVPFQTKVQIRGSKLPKWFPGYMSTFPHLPELVKISRSPSEVLHSAWKAVQPKIFPEDSLLIV